jgi:hypothetical protein
MDGVLKIKSDMSLEYGIKKEGIDFKFLIKEIYHPSLSLYFLRFYSTPTTLKSSDKI